MTTRNVLQECPPATLAAARDMAHKAVQLVSKAARANLPAVPDDSHSNLGWDTARGVFMSQPITAADQGLAAGLVVSDLTLQIVKNGQVMSSLGLARVADSDALQWLDAELIQQGLKPASPVALPYELPATVAEIGTYATDGLSRSLATLGAWYGLAESILAKFAADQTDIQPGASAVRCWPHHFDIATYVSLEAGDFETARGVGVGMSPGDDSYPQPYFYVNPWPHPAVDDLPEPPVPGHWHTQGFVGAIATGDRVLSLPDVETGLAKFIAEAFAIGRRKLGA